MQSGETTIDVFHNMYFFPLRMTHKINDFSVLMHALILQIIQIRIYKLEHYYSSHKVFTLVIFFMYYKGLARC